MDGLTITELATEDFKKWLNQFPKITFDQARALEPVFMEAWIRGFAYRMTNGEANNVSR